MKRNSAFLTVVLALVLVLSFGLAACSHKNDPPEKATYAVTIPVGEGYTVVGETSVKEGENYTFSVNIADGYNGDNMVVKVNGDTVTAQGGTFTVNSVSGNLVITVTGVRKNAPASFTVTLPEGAGLSAAGKETVTAGEDYSFTLTVATGYDAATLVVKNGDTTLTATKTEGNVYTYLIPSVQGNITVTATVSKLKFKVTLPTEEEKIGFAIVGETEAEYGENYTFTVVAVTGYSVANAVVKNGETVLTGTNGVYTVENVTADISITVTNVEKLSDYIGVTKKSYDLKLSAVTDAEKAAAYYMTGVTGVYQNEECEVVVDLSAADFTAAGSYTITYKLAGHETVTETATVNIYGLPDIAVAEDAVTTVSWAEDLDLTAFISALQGKISAKDSLLADLTVELKTETVPAKNVYGFYDIASYNVVFTATDKMGNVQEKTVRITVNQAETVPEISAKAIDLGNTAVKITEYEAGVDFVLYRYDAETGLVAVTNAQAAFDAANDGTFFAASYLGTLTLGEHIFVAVFENTFVTFSVTLTDNQAPAYVAADETDLAYLTGETFVLPTAIRNANSAQAITVKYFLDETEFAENPATAGAYAYTIRFYRNDAELTEYRKTYSLKLVDNYGWSGAIISALSDGNVALSGSLSGDANAILSAEYIAANKGENDNVVVVSVQLRGMGTNADASLWYLDGVSYITTEGAPENYIGWSQGNGMIEGGTLTMKLRIEENGTATFILRDFDGLMEVTAVSFEAYEQYIPDPNFTKGYAERVELTYDAAGDYIANAEISIPAGRAWHENTPAFTAEYLHKLYEAGKRYMALTPSYGDNATSFLYAYIDAEGNSKELWDINSGETKVIPVTDNTAVRFSKVDVGGGQGLTGEDVLSVAVTYYTQEEYDAIQEELARAAARKKLSAMTEGEGNFWGYFHHGAWGDTAWGSGNKVVKLNSSNMSMQKQLIDDAKVAGYPYMIVRIKATATAEAAIDNICFTSNPQWDFYWSAFDGNDVTFRLNLGKYFEDYTFSEDNIVMTIKGRNGANDASCNLEFELIGFEEANDKHFITVGNSAAYTVTGDTYALLAEGESKTFTIVAADGYTVDSVECDGATVVKEGDTYTVSGATKDAQLKINTHVSRHTVTLEESAKYTADAYSKTVNEGETVLFTITATTDWAIDEVTADNGATVERNGDVYTVSGVTQATRLTVIAHSTKKVEFSVTVAAGDGFTVAEELPAISIEGANVTLTITAKEGFRIDGVTANAGATVTADGNVYTISNITADTVVTVATTDLSALAKAAEERIAGITKSEGGFYRYIHMGAWGENTWGEDNTLVNIRGGNFTIERTLIDDALLAGYTHMKFHVNAVAEDGSAIDNITMITEPGTTWNYYWKQYSCAGETDLRVDLTVFAREGHETDALKVNINNTNLSSAIAISGIEFYKSEQTTDWTNTNDCVYVAIENGDLVIDTIAAGNEAHAAVGAARLAELKEKCRYIRFIVQDVSKLVGQVWIGNGEWSGDNAHMQGLASDAAFPTLVVDLAKCTDKLELFFTSQEAGVRISYEFISANYKADHTTECVAEGLDSTKATVVKFKYNNQGANNRSPIFGKTSANVFNALPIAECTDLGDGWYQFTIDAGLLDEDGKLYFTLDNGGSFFYEITQE